MHICQKYKKFSSFTHFCRVSKSAAIYALYPESFCMTNLAIRKVFAFSDSAVYGRVCANTRCRYANTQIQTRSQRHSDAVHICPKTNQGKPSKKKSRFYGHFPYPIMTTSTTSLRSLSVFKSFQANYIRFSDLFF